MDTKFLFGMMKNAGADSDDDCTTMRTYVILLNSTLKGG